MDEDFVSLKHSHCPLNLVKIFDIAFPLILSTRRVESHTHVLNSFVEELLPTVQVIERAIFLILRDGPRVLRATLVHHDLISSLLILLFLLLPTTLQVGRHFSQVLLPGN